jgi:hypothetical protein
MNKRIHELAREAGLPTYNPEGIPTKLEKFSELIMQESRKWVGLSDEQKKIICEAYNIYPVGLIEDIEAKLKEKNNP